MKTILSQLEGAGMLERRAGKLRSLRTFSCMQEMADFLGEYERRYTSDRERLDQMMRYAETTFCRTRILREYFGEESGKDCGHCDNCRSKAEGKSNPRHPRFIPERGNPSRCKCPHSRQYHKSASFTSVIASSTGGLAPGRSSRFQGET